MKQSVYIYSQFGQAENGYLIEALSSKYNLYFHNQILENIQFDTFLKCEYCLGNVPLEWCKANNNLKWLQLHSAGIDPYNQLSNPGFIITNLRGFFAESVAETTLAGILAFYRGIDRLVNYQAENQWVGNTIRPTLQKLHRKKVWVLGGGSIANKFIQLLVPFNCSIDQSPLSELIMNAHSIGYFDEKASDADLLVLILPETPETTHYLDSQKLSRLNAKIVVVNAGRGSSINEIDLKKYLIEKRIAGAILDVTEKEPIDENDSLWNMPNVILTQHSAGGWDLESRGKVLFFVEQIQRYENQEMLLNLVDCERGY
jgi:glyoxylate/hydroxypyruvate reductase